MDGKEINKGFVPLQQSVELKELGFDKYCFGEHVEYRGRLARIELEIYQERSDTQFTSDEQYDVLCKAPLYQQAFDWFLEKHNLWFRPDYPFDDKNTYSGSIHKIGSYSSMADVPDCDTPEEAKLACLKGLIEIVSTLK